METDTSSVCGRNFPTIYRSNPLRHSLSRRGLVDAQHVCGAQFHGREPRRELCSAGPEPTSTNRTPLQQYCRNRKVRLAESMGSYSRAWKSSPATVWLYVDNIVEAGSDWWRWVPVLRYTIPVEVLYHEIGHHIHAEHRPVHDGRENVAEDWSGKLWGNFCRKHYWYLFPFLYALARIASPIVKRLKRMKRTPSG